MKKSIILTLFLFFVAQSFAGWMFVEKKSNPQGMTTYDTVYVQSNKMRSGSKEATYIYDLDAQKITVINNFYKTYWTGTPEAYKQGVIAGLKEQMEVIVNRLPKEKQAAARKRLEDMLAEMQKPTNTVTTASQVVVKKIIDKITVLGYNTQRYELWIEGKKKLSVWTSEKILINNDFNLAKFSALMQRLMSNNPKLAIKSSAQYIDVLKKGYPLKTIEHQGNGDIVGEVVVAKKSNYPASIFTPSPGCKMVALDVLIKSMKIKG